MSRGRFNIHSLIHTGKDFIVMSIETKASKECIVQNSAQ